MSQITQFCKIVLPATIQLPSISMLVHGESICLVVAMEARLEPGLGKCGDESIATG